MVPMAAEPLSSLGVESAQSTSPGTLPLLGCQLWKDIVIRVIFVG